MMAKHSVSAALAALMVCSPGVAVDAVQWRVEQGGNGHWYAFRSQPEHVCWSTARASAESENGHLVTLTSAEEDNWVRTNIVIPNNMGCGFGGPLTGGTCEGRPWGQWYWITDEPFAYSGFANGEPNSGGNEQYIHYWDWCGGLHWNDTVACGSRTWIVEWSADCNNDGVVDYGQILNGALADENSNGMPDGCECLADTDGDGVNDCDDGCPLNPELAAPIDFYADMDGDGFGAGSPVSLCDAIAGFVTNNIDCDDSNPAVNPGAPELRNGIDDDCDAFADEQCNEVTLAMALAPGVIEPAGEIVVRIGAIVDSHAIFPLVGLQSAIRFDASRLAFVDATPGDGSPLPLEIAEIADSGVGTLLYAVGTMPPASGVTGSTALVDIRFAVRPEAELCAQDAQLVWFEAVAGWDTKFTMGGGAAVIPTLVSSAPIDLDQVAPVLVGVPAPTTVPADAGRLGAFVADPGVTATDACGAPAIAITTTSPSGATTPGWPADSVFPIGTSVVRWTATDAQGNSTSAETTVTVETYQLADLAIELFGAFDPQLPPFERTIRLRIGAATSMLTRSFVADPVDPTKRRASIDSLEIPATVTPPCIAVKDTGFSLSDSSSASVAGARYAASLALLQGDSNDDDAVDIIDFGLWFIDVGPATAASRSNFNADGFVNPADFGWIDVHFFRRGEACGGGLAGGEPIRRISLKELRRRGLGELAAADINRDGWLDMHDASPASLLRAEKALVRYHRTGLPPAHPPVPPFRAEIGSRAVRVAYCGAVRGPSRASRRTFFRFPHPRFARCSIEVPHGEDSPNSEHRVDRDCIPRDLSGARRRSRRLLG